MTTTVETSPETTESATAGAPESSNATASTNSGRRHRTVRHVAVHGGSAGAMSAAAEVLHVFGPTGLGFGAAAVAAAGAGVVAVRRRGKSTRRTARGGSLVRTVRRSVKTASGSRGAAGLRQANRRASSSARGSAPNRTGAPRRGTASAGLRAGSSQRANKATRRPGPGSAGGKSGTPGKTLHRRTRKPSIGGGRGSAASRRPGAASAHRPGAKRSGRPGADPRDVRLGNKIMRRVARSSRAKDAIAARPGGKHAAPVTRAGKIRRKASVHGRAATRVARRQAARSWRFAKAGAKASRPYLRLRPPKSSGKPAMRAAAKPASTKTAKKPTAATAKKAVAKTVKTAPPIKKTVKKTPANPGTAITAPGLTVKDIMDASSTSSSLSINAVTEAIREHIAGFEPENAIEILGFLSGLDSVFTELGSSLVTVSEKLGGEHPVDSSVVDMLQHLGAHALTLAEYGTQTSGLFRAAHESELARIESPRVREEDWDVERNR